MKKKEASTTIFQIFLKSTEISFDYDGIKLSILDNVNPPEKLLKQIFSTLVDYDCIFV